MRACLLLALAPLAAAQTPEQLIAQGHWKRARAVVEAMPSDARSTFLLSQIRAAFGDRDSPLPLAEKAVALEPGNAIYHRQVAECLGVAAQHANIFQQAMLARRFRKEIDLAIQLDPRNLQALRDLIEYYLLAPGLIGGDPRKASALADQIAAIDASEGWLARAHIADFHKDRTSAEKYFLKAVDVDPDSYRARIALALFTGSEEQALRAIEIDSTRVDAYSLLAAIYAGRADLPKLDEILKAAAAKVPDDLTPYYRAAERLISKRRDLDRAARYLKVYLSQPPEGNQPTTADAQRLIILTSHEEHSLHGDRGGWLRVPVRLVPRGKGPGAPEPAAVARSFRRVHHQFL